LIPSRHVGFHSIATPHYMFPQDWVALNMPHSGSPAHLKQR
jgi:hypothetical protein